MDTKKRSILFAVALASAIFAPAFAMHAAFESRASTCLPITMNARNQGIDMATMVYYIPTRPASYITVLTPSHSSSWNTGSCHAITWIINSSIPYVNIKLANKWYDAFTITTGIPNTGSYNWSIPALLGPGVHYEIEIEDYQNS